MNRFYLHHGLKFKRHADDGLIHPVCHEPINAGDVVCFEIPAKSTAQNFKLDVFRYTMQCVYGGECLFPCAFNQAPPDDNIKVFFDYVFRTTYKRAVSEKLALALYHHNRTNHPFLYKTLGVFGKNSDAPNCLRVSYPNGEAFIAATTDISLGEVLTVAAETIMVPTQKEEGDLDSTLCMLSNVDIADTQLFAKALSYRAKAARVRPKGCVVHVNSEFDPGLDKRIAKYTMDKEMGFTEFYAGVGRIGKQMSKDDDHSSLEVEELYNKLNDAFESENANETPKKHTGDIS